MAVGISLDIKSELPKGIKWTNAHTKQLPFSIAQAITATAKGVRQVPESKRKNIVADFERYTAQKLDRPKPQTQKGYRATTANKRTLSLWILAKEKPFNRTRYIVGNIKGGERPRTKFTTAFARLGDLPTGQVLVPTKNVPRDKFGGPQRRFVSAAIAKTTRNPQRVGDVFVGRPNDSERPFGVYKIKAGSRLQALFIAKDRAIYPRQLDGIYKLANARAKNVFGRYFRRLLEANVRAEMKR